MQNLSEEEKSSKLVIPSDYKGVNTHLLKREDTEYVLKKAKEAGIAWIRDDIFSWVNIDSGKNKYHWDRTNSFVETTKYFEVLGILGTIPTWANGKSEKDWKCGDPNHWWYMPNNSDDFGSYAYKAALRYKNIKAWEIWNEPNLYAFNPPHPNAQKYAELLKTSYRNIKKANPTTIVVGGALGDNPTRTSKIDAWCGSYTQTDISPEDFLEKMYAYGVKDNFDVLSLHIYGNNLESLRKIREIMLKNEDDKPIWITEAGFLTSSEQERAQKLKEIYEDLKKYDYVKKFFYYMLYDETDGNQPDQNVGLLKSKPKNHQEKPAFKVMKEL